MPRRRPRPPGWVPDQHGAWAMLLAPVVVGVVHGGPAWVHVLLLATWLVGYLAFYATGLWLRARRRPRYRPPVIAYVSATTALGLTLLLLRPELAGWGLLYAPLAAVSLVHSARRRDRALLNDTVTVVAACLMTVVAAGLGSHPADVWPHAAVLLGYFLGTVLYVKTMIRERGSRRMYAASVVHHLLVLLAAVVTPVPGAVVAVLAVVALRAALVPRVWPRATPKQVGIGEIVATTTLVLTLLAW